MEKIKLPETLTDDFLLLIDACPPGRRHFRKHWPAGARVDQDLVRWGVATRPDYLYWLMRLANRAAFPDGGASELLTLLQGLRATGRVLVDQLRVELRRQMGSYFTFDSRLNLDDATNVLGYYSQRDALLDCARDYFEIPE